MMQPFLIPPLCSAIHMQIQNSSKLFQIWVACFCIICYFSIGKWLKVILGYGNWWGVHRWKDHPLVRKERLFDSMGHPSPHQHSLLLHSSTKHDWKPTGARLPLEVSFLISFLILLMLLYNKCLTWIFKLLSKWYISKYLNNSAICKQDKESLIGCV